MEIGDIFKSLMILSRKRMARGIPKLKQKSQCEDYVTTKQARNFFPSGVARRANSCLKLIHIDLCGPMSKESLGGNRCFYLFVDDYSRWCWVFFIKTSRRPL